LDRFIASSGVSTRLSAIGAANVESITYLVASVNAERLQNNPRRVPPYEILNILNSIR